MIEYLALGAGLAFCLAGLRWRDNRAPFWWWAALAFGLVAALVKPPTFVVCALPLALTRDRLERAGLVGWLRARLDPRLIALGLLPVVVAEAWLAYGDALKAASPATSFLSSTGALWGAYYYGTLADRFSASYLERVGGVLGHLAIGRFALAFVLLGAVAATRAARPSLWLGAIAAIVIPVEIFWGAYRQHDYYSIAI